MDLYETIANFDIYYIFLLIIFEILNDVAHFVVQCVGYNFINIKIGRIYSVCRTYSCRPFDPRYSSVVLPLSVDCGYSAHSLVYFNIIMYLKKILRSNPINLNNFLFLLYYYTYLQYNNLRYYFN